MKSHFLRAEWNNLIMANYAVPRELLLPFLPYGTELDFFQDKVFVSLIGFMFEKTNILGFNIPYHINFEEVNLRFYVRRFDNGVWKRGTVFIKEIVPRFAISFFANSLYGENYSTMKMRHSCSLKNNNIELSYEWKYKNKWNKIAALCDEKGHAMAADSLEEFIAEHYWGFTKITPRKTFEYEVSHPRWDVFDVLQHTIDCDFGGLYGHEFSFLNDTPPSSVFMAKGSAIKIHHKKTLS